MKEYHKIQTVFLRDPATKFRTLLPGVWATPEFEYLRDLRWVWTEKIDGTNIRVIFDDGRVVFKGKTDEAQIYAPLVEVLQKKFPVEVMRKQFPDGGVCLYGEGFGARIQKGGGNYLPDGVDFCLFDAIVGGTLLRRDSLEDIASWLSIDIAPIVSTGTLPDAIDFVQHGFKSAWGDFMAEGLVMRPEVELRDRKGHRIITKIKHIDFA